MKREDEDDMRRKDDATIRRMLLSIVGAVIVQAIGLAYTQMITVSRLEVMSTAQTKAIDRLVDQLDRVGDKIDDIALEQSRRSPAFEWAEDQMKGKK